MARTAARVAVALGSNSGDRLANLRFGAESLVGLFSEFRCSRVFETEPMYVSDQARFLNACCTGRTDSSAEELLGVIQQIERHSGRRRGGRRYGPRPLDLDLLLHGDQVIDEPHLTVPHPRMRDRAFVLIPLAELASDWLVPGLPGNPVTTVGQLAAAISAEGVVLTGHELPCG